MMRILLKVLFIVLPVVVFGQVQIGEWESHLPYYFCNKVMVTDDKAICSSTGGLFYYKLQDNSLHTFSKTDGLSDNSVSAMNWMAEGQLALIAYDNANVDILIGDEVVNIPDILKKQIPGDKSIYDVYFLNNKAYLSCGFGIVVVDIEKYEITDTYYIGEAGDALKVSQVASDGTYIYAATEKGIKRALISNPFLIDYNSWEEISDIPNSGGPFSGIVAFNGRVFTIYDDPLGIQDKLYYFDNSWKEYSQYTEAQCTEIRVEEEFLLLSGRSGVQVMSKDFIFVMSYEEGYPKSAIIDSEGIIWIADYGRGMIRVSGNEEQSIKPNGPYSSIAYNMASAGGVMYAVSGGVSTVWGNLFRSGTLHTYKNQTWGSNIKYEYKDFITMAIDPNDHTHLFAGSWGYGVVEYRESKIVASYGESNSSLQSIIPGGDAVRIGGLDFDNEGNLWMTNTGVAEPISVLKPDGTWKSFKAGGLISQYPALSEVLVSQSGHLWAIIPKGNGLFAMNFNGTIDNTEDDEYKLVNVVDEYGKVITNEVFSFAEDHNGNIWLGTNQGILVYYSPSRLFTEGSLYAQEIVVPRNDGTNYGDPLLLTEKVTAIEVDGANRKWLGTADGGAFLVSPNGLKLIHNFNSGNSPLLSNSITDICVNGESGEVFFGTDKGIISFRGEATLGADVFDNVKVFPNPVREDYNGPIAISGLMEETTVKITDVAGNLVNEMLSFGGQAIWDGKNFNGERVATGVYLIFLANRDASAAHVTKILFIH
ncbi:two-component regulator propeller domain-containing protein [Bacteroidota bacterium]